ncbi:MAG: cytochrome c peroxidase [Pseudomonadota bacterium]
MNKSFCVLIIIVVLAGCGGGSGDGANLVDVVPLPAPPAGPPEPQLDLDDVDLDDTLGALILAEGLMGDAAFNRGLPSIENPLAQLGKKLFFSKSLSGQFDVACVSCHHPSFGGSDALSLPVGVGANQIDLLGPGREAVDGTLIPRNSPTVFNAGLWDAGMFWDSRVASIGEEPGANGSASAIVTPDANPDDEAGANLAVAQSRFPVTSAQEMKSDGFEAGSSNQSIRDHLAARVGNYGAGVGELLLNEWLNEFQTAYASSATAEELVTFANISEAIGEYERSMVFTDHPFRAYIEGDTNALTDAQKRGAILFYTDPQDGGGGCAACHSGDTFTDGAHHTVAFPQFGPGKGDGNADDFGRERVSGSDEDRYRFRTPSLLNVEVTAPYGHAGTYESLNQVLAHYNDARDTVDDFFDDGGACSLEQFEETDDCEDLFPFAAGNSNEALDKLDDERAAGTAEFVNTNLNNNERNDIVAFLRSLTDPCVLDRACLAPWIADTTDDGPDGQQLNAVDGSGTPL